MREGLSENPDLTRGVARDDVLSALLSTIRLSGSLQFCFMPSGNWQTDATPSMANLSGKAIGTVPFHIVAAGHCWLKMEGQEAALEPGDVLVFPFGTGHQLGSGGTARSSTRRGSYRRSRGAKFRSFATVMTRKG